MWTLASTYPWAFMACNGDIKKVYLKEYLSCDREFLPFFKAHIPCRRRRGQINIYINLGSRVNGAKSAFCITAALVPALAVKDLPLGRTLMMITIGLSLLMKCHPFPLIFAHAQTKVFYYVVYL